MRAQSVGVRPGAGSGQEDSLQQPEPTQDLLWRTAERRSTSLLRVQAGVDGAGEPTFNGSGRFFAYLDDRTGFQAQGALDYSDDRREGQFDVGLVRRVQSTQVGLFASFKYASFRQFDEGGLLAQAAATFDYLFPRARLGLFGTKGFRDRVVLQQGGLLQVVDQVGISGQLRLDVFNGAYVDIFGDAYLEGDIAYLYSAGEEGRVGGALRLVVPAGQDWAVTAEGGWNDTVLANKSSRRFLVGVQLGLWVRPPHVGAIRSRVGTSGSH